MKRHGIEHILKALELHESDTTMPDTYRSLNIDQQTICDWMEKYDHLRTGIGWYPGISTATVVADGFCEYCCIDLLASRPGYSSIGTDHLLPKATYEALKDHSRNQVSCCSSCNWMKSSWDPLKQGEDAKSMLEKHREELIQRVREHLNPKIEDREKEWQSVRDKFREV